MKTILEYYNKLFKLTTKNLALTITASNVIFLLLILLIKDPFGLRISSYEKATPFVKTSSSSIGKITIEKTKVPNSKFELKKEGDNWILTAKGKTLPADSEKINTLLKSIINSRRYTVVSSSKDKASEYGFNEDELKVEIFDNANSVGYFLLGSIATSDANSSHVKWKEEDDIYLVEENLKSATNRGDFTHFLNKRVSPTGLTSADIIGITLKKAGNDYEIKKTTIWNLENPKKGEISNDDMNAILSKASSINSDDLVIDDSSLNGIDPNPFELKIDFKTKDGIPMSFTLISAGFDKKINAYYIRKNNDPSIYKLNDYSIKSILDFKPETLIKK